MNNTTGRLMVKNELTKTSNYLWQKEAEALQNIFLQVIVRVK
uniref:Uncharacterized protein n=1 Tax=Arundo donax TaxID=35708 RepID=A0A0A9H9N7_ARUDO